MVKADNDYWRGVGLLITNNSDITIGELDIQVLYYDDAGNIIDTEDEGHDVVLPGSTVVSYVSAPDKYAKDDYNLEIDIYANSSYTNHAEKMDVKTNKGDNCIILQITYNADVDIDEFEYVVVFYKGGEIVDVTHGTDVYDIKVGKNVVDECSTWGVDFDSYKVYINQAHTFGW